MIEFVVVQEVTEPAYEDMKKLLDQFHAGSTNVHTPDINNFRHMAQTDDCILMVARDGKRIVGTATLYIIVKVDEVSGYLDGVVVDNAYRGKGIATQLMQKLIDMARERKLSHVDLTSRPSREAANRLYQKIGFLKRETNPYRLKL